jgi:hypothetical protein
MRAGAVVVSFFFPSKRLVMIKGRISPKTMVKTGDVSVSTTIKLLINS